MYHAHAAFGVEGASSIFAQGFNEYCSDRAWNLITIRKHSEAMNCPSQSRHYLIKHNMLISSNSPEPKCYDYGF